ncbi:MAG: response regulator [Eubacterium sp.]|nr:response regulator [Eubacterium sp.]
MFKLMLLDDEAIVLQGIQKVFDLPKHGYEVVGAYQDGTRALEELAKKQPDLVITDIKMPKMTGIEFVTEAKKILPNAEYVILSGYGDFVFAQEALKLGVADYLLKPIEKDAFGKMLDKMHEKIAQKHDEMDYAYSVNSWIQTNKEELKNRFFISLAEDNVLDEKLYQMLKVDLKMDVDETPFIMIKLETYHMEFQSDYLSEMGELVSKVTEELSQYGRIEQFLLDESIALLVYPDEEHEEMIGDMPRVVHELYQPLEKSMQKLIDEHKKVGIHLVAGISKIHKGLRNIFVARNECIKAIFLQEANLQDTIDSKEQVYASETHIPYDKIEELFRETLVSATEDRIAQVIDDIYNEIKKRPANVMRDTMCTTTFLILLRIYQQQIRIESRPDIVQIGLLDLQQLQQTYPTLEDQKRITFELSKTLAIAMNSNHGMTSNKIIADALAYMEEHYKENLSLQHVADAIGISKNYLSNLFKKELDITFVNYLTGLRIEKAKGLLKEGNLKMYEVAEAVGYNDYAYFSQIFKKHTGVTLSAFRSRAS